MSNNLPLTSTQKPLSRNPETILKNYSALSKKLLTVFIIVGAVISLVLFLQGTSKSGSDTFILFGCVAVNCGENFFSGLLTLLVMESVWIVIGSAFSIAINLVGDIIAHMAYFANNDSLDTKESETETNINNDTYDGSLLKKTNENRTPNGQPAAGEWTCSKCGKVNQNYVGTCGCGEVKPK